MNEREAWIAFSTFTAIGSQRFKLLIQFFGSAGEAWTAPIKTYREIGFSERLASSFDKHRKTFSLASYLKQLHALKVEVYLLGDKNYPVRLASLDDAPFVLYVRSEVAETLADLTEISLAVIG